MRVKRRFSTQLGEINSLAFMTESSFIGFCLENENKFEQKKKWEPEPRARARCAGLNDRLRVMLATNKAAHRREGGVAEVEARSSGAPHRFTGSVPDKQMSTFTD